MEKIIFDGLRAYKYHKIIEVKKYDKSKKVNSFILNGVEAWIDRETRVSLMNSTNILKNAGQETVTLWLNNIPYILSCDLLIQLLNNLEIYALQCYNTTEQHKANINNLTSIEEIQNYDYKLNYPEKLIFNL